MWIYLLKSERQGYLMARIYPLFSGSKGNAYYLGDKDSGILIDAGKNSKQICLKLNAFDINPFAVKGILVTHEHNDHISALRVFASKFNIPVFTSKGTANHLIKNGVANGKFRLNTITNGLQIADMEINYFNISHDCNEGIGFRIKTPDKKIVGFATDLGYLSDEVQNGLEGSNLVVIESNYDKGMLQCGPYPYMLKKRIMSDEGHLSNEDTANYMPILHKNGTKRFILGHLSDENNTPRVAIETANCAMSLAGYVKDVDFSVMTAPRENDGQMVIF